MGFRLVIAMLLAAAPACQAAPLAIVAAEGVYADVARQVAGPDAVVAAIENMRSRANPWRDR